MAQNTNNILIKYKEDKILFRILKIKNNNILEVDELVENKQLAEDLLNNLVTNTEKQYGFKGQYSHSSKNKIFGDKALIVVTFGNLGLQVVMSVKPVVTSFENLKEVHIASEDDYITINNETPSSTEKKGLLDKIKSFIS